MSAKAPYPIKDYQDASQYPARKSVNAWRWEFLRRNPEYQAFHAEHKDCDPRKFTVWQFGLRSLYDPIFDDAYQGMLPPASIIQLPTFEDVEKWEHVSGYTAERGVFMLLRNLTELQYQGDTLVTINRALPIEPQLDAIRESVARKNELDGVNPAFKRDQSAKWPLYLRVLDGKAANASDDEIAAAVYPDADNVYPDYPGRKVTKAAAKQARYLSEIFATKSFSPEK